MATRDTQTRHRYRLGGGDGRIYNEREKARATGQDEVLIEAVQINDSMKSKLLCWLWKQISRWEPRENVTTTKIILIHKKSCAKDRSSYGLLQYCHIHGKPLKLQEPWTSHTGICKVTPPLVAVENSHIDCNQSSHRKQTVAKVLSCTESETAYNNLPRNKLMDFLERE